MDENYRETLKIADEIAEMMKRCGHEATVVAARGRWPVVEVWMNVPVENIVIKYVLGGEDSESVVMQETA